MSNEPVLAAIAELRKEFGAVGDANARTIPPRGSHPLAATLNAELRDIEVKLSGLVRQVMALRDRLDGLEP